MTIALPAPAKLGRVFKWTDGKGYGVEPCPGCDEQLRPGDARVCQSGEWRVYHEFCWNVKEFGDLL